MGILPIAIIIFIFNLLFIIFAYSKTTNKTGIWIIIMILFTLIIGMTTVNGEKVYVNQFY